MTWLFVRIRPDEVSTIPVPAAHVSSSRRFVLMTTTPVPIGDALSRVAAIAAPLPIAASATRKTARVLVFRISMWIRSARPGRDLSVTRRGRLRRRGAVTDCCLPRLAGALSRPIVYTGRVLMTTTSLLADVGIELREGYAEVGDQTLHYV